MYKNMYGYRQSSENNLMTNLNSISSSLSSIDTIGRRTGVKASVDNLIAPRTQSIASTSLLWKGDKNDRYSAIKNGIRKPGSEIYFDSDKSFKTCCFNSTTALNFILIPLLLLTITRQVFDFMGQLWLQIIINFFTIILVIFALFGVKQRRISYLSLFALWALFNSVWNLIVICIHTKIREVSITEDTLSFYTNSTSWWHSNGPGCLPYNLNVIQPTISIIQPSIITGCRLEYHTVEASQAALHSLLSFLSCIICCTLIVNIRKHPAYPFRGQPKADKIYRLNNLMSDRSKVNPDPSPSHVGSRYVSEVGSLRRGATKASARSSQHSVSSQRSARRRSRRQSEGMTPTPRESTSSTIQRSQKYGSISSRRSSSRREKRGEVSSLTYGVTGDRASTSQRARLSSLSSVDYLPSYQPPHSSSANLLSSYGEISSIDSYNNRTGQRSINHRQSSAKSIRGNTNPTYVGSRSSICSQNNGANNYDDLSYIYGNNSIKNSESIYGASSSHTNESKHRHQTQNRQNKLENARHNTRVLNQQAYDNPTIYSGNHQTDHKETFVNSEPSKFKASIPNGSFHSFSRMDNHSINSQRQIYNESRTSEINNNHLSFKFKDNFDIRNNPDGHQLNNGTNSYGSYSQNGDSPLNLSTVTNSTSQRMPMHHIYSNHSTNGNSETPI